MRRKKPKIFVDKIILAAAIIEPLFVLPQIFTIFRDHDAGKVSILTWLGFNALTAVWIWWAFMHKQRIIMLYQGLYFVFNTVVIAGAFIFGGKWF